MSLDDTPGSIWWKTRQYPVSRLLKGTSVDEPLFPPSKTSTDSSSARHDSATGRTLLPSSSHPRASNRSWLMRYRFSSCLE